MERRAVWFRIPVKPKAECIVHYVVNPDDAQSKLGEKTGTKTWEPPATPPKVENTQDWAEEKKIPPKERLGQLELVS